MKFSPVFVIGIKKFEGTFLITNYSLYLKPFEVDRDIIDCILRLKEFAPIEGFEVNNISINHPHFTNQSENVNITDDGNLLVKIGKNTKTIMAGEVNFCV